MKIILKPIGVVQTNARTIPRHWTISDIEGKIIIDEIYTEGLKNIQKGESIIIIFYFHQSPEFTSQYLIQTPPHKNEKLGVFSTCSPIRPNPVGMSILDVLDIAGNVIHVRGLDMIDGTPILDIKPTTGLKRDLT